MLDFCCYFKVGPLAFVNGFNFIYGGRHYVSKRKARRKLNYPKLDPSVENESPLAKFTVFLEKKYYGNCQGGFDLNRDLNR